MGGEKIFQRSKQHIYFKDHDIDFYFRLAFGYQFIEGPEYGECFHTASRISEGDPESRIRQTHATYERLSNPNKALRTFTEDEGADVHCRLNNFSLMQRIVFDWPDGIFRPQ